MSHPRFALFGLFVALLLLPPPGMATTVVAPNFDALVGGADYVVRAVVKSVTSEWRENKGQRFIASKIELEVKEVIRGAPPQPLVLDVIGGSIGEESLFVEGAPKFQVGDEDILFVQGNGRQIFPLVGMMHGRYPILRDAKSGVKYALRSNGMPLYSEQDVSLPMTRLSTVKAQNAATRPMTADTFIKKIREAGGGIRQTQEK